MLHAAVGEPGHGVAEHGGGGLAGLVVVDLGVGDAGVVVEDGVDERGPDQRVPERLVALAGAVGGDRAVLAALGPADVAPAAAVGDVAELLDVDVDQRAGVVVLVAADRLAGDPVDVGEPADPAPDQDLVDRRRGDAGLRRRSGPGPGAASSAGARSCGPRAAASGAASAAAARTRSPIPAGPSRRYRSAHRFAVGHDTS